MLFDLTLTETIIIAAISTGTVAFIIFLAKNAREPREAPATSTPTAEPIGKTHQVNVAGANDPDLLKRMEQLEEELHISKVALKLQPEEEKKPNGKVKKTESH